MRHIYNIQKPPYIIRTVSLVHTFWYSHLGKTITHDIKATTKTLNQHKSYIPKMYCVVYARVINNTLTKILILKYNYLIFQFLIKILVIIEITHFLIYACILVY